MNFLKRNQNIYKLESFWRSSLEDKTKDDIGKLLPYPKENPDKWSSQDQFTTRLQAVEEYIKSKKFTKYDTNKNCLLCDQKNIITGKYDLNNTFWEDGLSHYIAVHNIKPSLEFIDMIYGFNPSKRKFRKLFRFKSDVYEMKGLTYLKLDRNQLLIMDALMRHGGYTKKYIDKSNKKIYRYSEHAGLLDFNENGLEKIIISGKTNRIDRGDEEIYLPMNIPEAFDYEYIFHTHPPTPKPGGRAEVGILYELPSISDIFHFIDHFNKGMTQGSLVVAPEGLYNIRKHEFDRNKIKIDENEIYAKLRKVLKTIQRDALDKYGFKFNTYTFYAKIAQDKDFINKLNAVLNNYMLHVDYYPRIKDTSGKWIIDTIYLPVFVVEPNKINK